MADSKETEIVLSKEQLTLAAYVSCFLHTVDDLIIESGHEPIMHKIESSKLKEVLIAFAVAKNPEELVKPMCKNYHALETFDLNKTRYLKTPFKIGMVIARQIIEVK